DRRGEGLSRRARRGSAAMTPEGLTYDERGLIPAVVQEAETGEVLMVAWMDRAAVSRTLETGLTHFWSRSRQAPWRKGETSGHRRARRRGGPARGRRGGRPLVSHDGAARRAVDPAARRLRGARAPAHRPPGVGRLAAPWALPSAARRRSPRRRWRSGPARASG